MTNKLTNKQKRVLEFIRDYIRDNEQSPTIAEIQKFFHLKATRSVVQFLETLEEKGYIKRDGFKHRGITVLNNEVLSFEKSFYLIPLLASVGCDEGLVIADQRRGEFISVHKSIIPSSDGVYAFKAVGNSMVDGGVRNGDYVLVRKTPYVENNDKVVAILDGVAVLKRLHKTEDTLILYPEAEGYSPIILNRDFDIFGKLISVIPTDMGDNEEEEEITTVEPIDY